MKNIKKLICAAFAVLLILIPAAAAKAGAEQTTALPKRLDCEQKTLFYDFTDQEMSTYIRNGYTTVENRGSMKITDGTLRNSSAREMAFGSIVGVGDDYGLSEGYVRFKMSLIKGEIALGVRLPRTDTFKSAPGVWFSFSPDGKIKVTEKASGISKEIDSKTDFSEPVTVKYEEKLSHIDLYVNDGLIAKVSLDGGNVAVTDKDGSETRGEGADVDPAGFFSVYFAGSTDGYIDDLEFTHYDVDQTQPERTAREIDYTTWTATDDLGRTVASNEEAGDVRDEKYVGLFYFLCWTGAGIHVQDNTAIYLQSGVDGLKSHLEKEGGESYWAEPYFGYYRNTDTWVYRKHAYMLEAAGVDFIFLDVSNGVTYNEGHLALFDTWLQIRKEGGMTPQIVFFCGDRADVLNTDVQNLKRTVYSEANYEKYKELFFMWEGKPLIFGNANGSGVNAQTKEFLSNFTVRGNWAWCDQNGYWSWLQEYGYNKGKKEYVLSAGGLGRDENGNFEELSVCLGHHASTSKGRSYNLGKEPAVKNDFGFSLTTSGEGICFKTQFEAAMSYDPKVLLITGWNEWIAGCFHDPENTFFAGTKVNGYLFVDQFNTEFSRDAEPMRLRDGVGFGDNYYYQMCDYIRKFKGFGKTTEASGQRTVNIYDVSDWDGIGPEYMDNTGDTELRNTVGYDADIRYINNTGRNDFEYAKVSQDGEYLYFMAKCTADIERADGENWMNLFINTDGDMKTGWEGYDFVVNRERDGKKVSVSAFTEGFAADKKGEAEYCIAGEYMSVKIKKDLLGISGEVKTFLFKWADNSTTKGNVMEFMDKGDAAPNDRYAFSYSGYEGETVKPVETEENTVTEAQNGTEPAAPGEEKAKAPVIEIVAAAVAVAAVSAAIVIRIKKK